MPGGSLSSSGARKLLPPYCPAIFRYERNHPPAPTKALDLGTAAHKLVLGAGPELVRIDADEWRTKKVKAKVAAVRARGAIPLKPAEYDQVHAMAKALREHPTASALFHPDSGLPEQSLFWQDGLTGIWRRARLDWLRNAGPGRYIVPDYKTCAAADLESLRRTLQSLGYHCQADWYLDGVRALGGPPDAEFVFVCQEKTPPFLVNVIEPDAMAMRIARDRNRQAIETYVECVATGHWPGYGQNVELVSLPRWVEHEYLAEVDE
ncbi:PD-(D/E)XK nuclease-like domain-containing protein [Actinoallomurus purpureus]|uniref:PD-(D/E)XK nuclease-like domain-containing protein n=1 Tax=Actinoallomurus purpureus TaxID=478114 RepID=UPI002092EF80|nr:PD-(D/E)XK nuclease-like domain-containing protein [Actinoallomurus purpureus]MCO6011462.1 PD-(D/E)XK nuclease-like domain-containing protein [Actinoallomurus purpureus]